MTNVEPTRVFSRFPWTQLVFCVACLSMAGWMWMRYSYCWQMTSEEAVENADGIYELRWPMEAYIELDYRKLDASSVRIAFSGFPLETNHHVRRGRWSPYIGVVDRPFGELPAHETVITLVASGRFRGASVAGLVVGAMGCFIFGIYLRRWLRERNSAAQATPATCPSAASPG